MKTALIRVLVAAFVLPVLATTVFAQGAARRYDDLTFTALAAARDLRWEIYDEFARSRDQRHLLQDVENLITDLHKIQVLIYQRRPAHVVDRELDHAFEHVQELKSHLLSCDFAVHRSGSYHLIPKGYVYHPETHHSGNVHVDHAIQMLAGIEVNLNQLHLELTGLPASSAVPVIPNPVVVPTPVAPYPVYQVKPVPVVPGKVIPPYGVPGKGGPLMVPVHPTKAKSTSVPLGKTGFTIELKK
ncbi:hypothetical protein [Planctomicrobium sp. SH527]|uniref:hypothetical protein n=1 Tax=Planctomicrobium sp. SH527 TaxID=3448123 RepID=UPI003F5B8FC5